MTAPEFSRGRAISCWEVFVYRLDNSRRSAEIGLVQLEPQCF